MKIEALILMLIINGITVFFTLKFLWKVIEEEQ